jgi:Nuclease-related domain
VSLPLQLAIAFGVGFFVGAALLYGRIRYRQYQNEGEALVLTAVRRYFASSDYYLFNHVTLPLKDGTTQVDHILVSRFGVFVIETKHYSGWIFANPKQAKWTQVLYRRKSSFQNPIFQNLLHVKAVQNLLDFLPPECIQSAVVFTGDAEFKTAVPEGVFELADFILHVKECTNEAMTPNRMQFCVGRIETARLAVSGQTDIEHVQNLERRHGAA